ncbi:hypothetical protein DEO72_LG7g1033 [Vigna unguiculata]|uniref:Uncharacterized protein n=1 Tax=Vigna unguiculata TaxID=3917 RepID=A0A4D6MHN8_VIGUN|nr:hypothetical protein DEO72_LG7g1033 [Vigna unguiculata]
MDSSVSSSGGWQQETSEKMVVQVAHVVRSWSGNVRLGQRRHHGCAEGEGSNGWQCDMVAAFRRVQRWPNVFVAAMEVATRSVATAEWVGVEKRKGD